MISYDTGSKIIIALDHRNFRNMLRQPSLFRAMLVALPCAAMSACTKFMDHNMGFNFLAGIMPEDATYSSFTFLVTFFVVFHTSHAYQRFSEGAKEMYGIMGNFVDMFSQLIAFTRASKGSKEQTTDFKRKLVRLSSLLFAASVGELEGAEGHSTAFKFKLIDPSGLGQDVLERVVDARHKPEVVCQMLQSLIVDGIQSGVLSIPAPILTRAFQELSSAMVSFHQVRSCKEVPFPFPFVAVSELLLGVHWVATPFFMSFWCQGASGAAAYTFIVTLTLWCLHGVGLELDNPFGDKINNLNTEHMHTQLNETLLSVLRESSTEVLEASDLKEEGHDESEGRRASRTFTATDSLEGVTKGVAMRRSLTSTDEGEERVPNLTCVETSDCNK